MMNYQLLARTVIIDSLQVESGQHVFIDIAGEAHELVEALIHEIYEAGAFPYYRNCPEREHKAIIEQCSMVQLDRWASTELARLQEVDAYIGIRSESNSFELNDIAPEKMQLYYEHFVVPFQESVSKIPKWIVLRAPTPSMAQHAEMSSDGLYQLFMEACCMNYKQWALSVEPLVQLMTYTKEVRIVAPETDLTFRLIRTAPYVCDGQFNLPDGEVFTAPVIDSTEGTISFNVPTSIAGLKFQKVKMTFQNGKVVDIQCSNRDELIQLLDGNSGGRYIGEFGIGLNPYIQKPMGNILFDEKMFGSIHLALGQSYPMAYNGNESNIHLDFVLCLSEKYGGGELYFDGKLINRNGVFVCPELISLNDLRSLNAT
ncbi:aminopeptidase [Paenibacillus kobensis]|uniref:aminopeptidase n=1 Tax=Paenibacillus kobensis TaxID=59841 RepID=UPI000FD95AB6|nr:aminopeptidase [Paenibacillus kobensis]